MKTVALAISLIIAVLLISARWSSRAVNAPQAEGVIQTPVDSSSARSLSIEGMTDKSDLIAIGTCVDTKSAWVGLSLVTLTTIDVAETLKGTEQSTITVALPGGIDANRKFPVQMSYPGAPRIEPGEDVFLFLTTDDRNAGSYKVTGFSQGKFSIIKDKDGGQFITRDRTTKMSNENNGIRRGSSDLTPLSSLKAQVKSHLR